MKLHSTVLFVKDIDASKEFYMSVLKEKIEYDFGKNIIFKSGLAIWEFGDTHIIREKLGEKTYTHSNRFELYYETPDLIKTMKQLDAFSIEYLHKEHLELWGQKTIRFFDPDKHLIEIGETLHAFVGRMYEEKYSIKDISSATHIPICTVEKLIDEIIGNK